MQQIKERKTKTKEIIQIESRNQEKEPYLQTESQVITLQKQTHLLKQTLRGSRKKIFCRSKPYFSTIMSFIIFQLLFL